MQEAILNNNPWCSFSKIRDILSENIHIKTERIIDVKKMDTKIDEYTFFLLYLNFTKNLINDASNP